MKQIRKRLTYANVMSSIAVFLVLGGGAAIAANQLGKNTVGTKQLKKNAVNTAKLKNNAVTTAKVRDGAITGGKLASGSVTTDKIGSGAVTTDRITDGAVTGGKLANGAVTGGKIPNGTITGDKLANGAVTGGKIPNGTVTGDKLANGTVTGEKLATEYLPASTLGLPVAGANISASGAVRKWFNRFGGKPTVQDVGVGAYRITFPGLEGQAYFDNSVALVSLNNGEAGEIARTSGNGDPRVSTYDSAGNPTDKAFDFILFLPGTE